MLFKYHGNRLEPQEGATSNYRSKSEKPPVRKCHLLRLDECKLKMKSFSAGRRYNMNNIQNGKATSYESNVLQTFFFF